MSGPAGASRTGPPNPVFDQLFAASLPRVLDGSHDRDRAPVEGGRWPVTVVAAAPPELRTQLEHLLAEAVRRAGPGHFMTGRTDSAHLTVRALEPYREAAEIDDPIVGDWIAAMERVAADTPDFELDLTGLTLTAGGVLAQLEPYDSTPWDLQERLAAELGYLAWYEASLTRNIWYSSILHFGSDILDPRALVDWVAEHRRFSAPSTVRVTGLELVRFHHTITATGTEYMRPTSWHSVAFSGP